MHLAVNNSYIKNTFTLENNTMYMYVGAVFAKKSK